MTMTSKERMQAAVEGLPPDQLPVCASYQALYYEDHFDELTGQPRLHYQKWLYSPREEFLATLRTIVDLVPFDMLQVPFSPPESWRQRVRFVEEDGSTFLLDTVSGSRQRLVESKTGHAKDEVLNEEMLVRDVRDLREKFPVRRAEDHIRDGGAERAREIVEAFGDENYILAGGVAGTIFGCGSYVGQTNALAMFLEKPDFMHELCKHYTEHSVEWIRAICSAGGDAIYLDDAMAGNDMISPAVYEEFCVPHLEPLVAEAHSHNHKVILIYFGGVMDRLEQIASLGADVLAPETSMKGYVNDIGAIADRVGDRMTLFGNVNPYDHLERLSDDELEQVMREQAEAGRRARGFVMATGSPITVGTPLARAQKFIELARGL